MSILSSPEPKAQVTFPDQNLSIVRVSCCRRCCRKLITFSSSSLEPLGQFQPNLAQSIGGWRWFKFVQMKGHILFSRGDNYEIVNYIDKGSVPLVYFKLLFNELHRLNKTTNLKIFLPVYPHGTFYSFWRCNCVVLFYYTHKRTMIKFLGPPTYKNSPCCHF